jgi:hypothetical protein
MGTPGSRKSTAIKMAGKIVRAAGFNSISTGKTTKEAFIENLAKGPAATSEWGELEQNLFGEYEAAAANNLIVADEMNDFFGNSILDFVSFLGTLWDWEGPYESKVKNGPTVGFNNPTISFLAGTTPGTFASTFPPEIIGQGFFSRTILIHGEPNGKRIAFPKPPSEAITAPIVESFRAVISRPASELSLDPGAESILSSIYATDSIIMDGRFATYKTRRFTHLLKLCIIIAAATASKSINEHCVIYANTVLHYAEQFMPMALGEFGRARSAGSAEQLISLVDSAPKVWTYNELWTSLSSEFESIQDMARVCSNLIQAGKLQYVADNGKGSGGVLPMKKLRFNKTDPMAKFTDYSLLTQEERNACNFE